MNDDYEMRRLQCNATCFSFYHSIVCVLCYALYAIVTCKKMLIQQNLYKTKKTGVGQNVNWSKSQNIYQAKMDKISNVEIISNRLYLGIKHRH